MCGCFHDNSFTGSDVWHAGASSLQEDTFEVSI